MIWALTIVCLAQAGALTYAFKVLARTVREHEQTAALERAGLLNRIQAPEIAVAHSAQKDLPPDEPAVHPDLPKQYFDAIDRITEMEHAA